MTGQPFGATNQPGTCKWCGRKLRRPTNEGRSRLVRTGNSIEAVSIPKSERTPRYDKPGDYGDGHFCGLRCAYMFAVRMADEGMRLHTGGRVTRP